jgi:hypothetical protein
MDVGTEEGVLPTVAEGKVREEKNPELLAERSEAENLATLNPPFCKCV